jgi:hypothetical protein
MLSFHFPADSGLPLPASVIGFIGASIFWQKTVF